MQTAMDRQFGNRKLACALSWNGQALGYCMVKHYLRLLGVSARTEDMQQVKSWR